MMNCVRSGGLILGGLLPALLLTAGGVFAQEPTARDGAITGRVLEADGRRPVGQVDVLLVGMGRRAVADGRGRFRFDSVPAGEQRLRVRHLGFRSRELTVHVPPDQIVGVTVRLDPEPVALDPLDVQVESELRIPRLAEEGYYYRRELDFGHFFGPQYLSKWSGMRVRSLVERVPSLRVPSRRGRPIHYIEDRQCPTKGIETFYLDGNRLKPPLPNLAVTEIAAMEIYRGPAAGAGLPVPLGPCGAVLIWTWRGPNPFHDSVGERYACPERLKRFREHAC